MSTTSPTPDVPTPAPSAAAPDGGRRRYDGSGRQKDAEQRRGRMIEAARALFLEQGYGATSIEDIARRAETSAQTVYAAFGNKAGLLRRVIDVAIGGDEQEVKAFDRPDALVALNTHDLPRRFRLIAELAAATHRRSGELIHLAERVAGSDPVVAALSADLRRQLRDDTARMLADIPLERRRTDVSTEQLIDISIVLGEARTWHALVIEQRWTDDQYVDWLADAMDRNILAHT
jgi:AcrR family transcriptional regulator